MTGGRSLPTIPSGVAAPDDLAAYGGALSSTSTEPSGRLNTGRPVLQPQSEPPAFVDHPVVAAAQEL
jgi:hypothetical protein